MNSIKKIEMKEKHFMNAPFLSKNTGAMQNGS